MRALELHLKLLHKIDSTMFPGKIKYLDLTHPLTTQMPIYPGSPKPTFKELATIEANGYREKLIILSSHTGTHLDAPAHIFDAGDPLEEMDIDMFCGNGFCLKKSSDIEVDDLKKISHVLENVDFLLLSTKWSTFWGEPEYFSNYPVFTEKAAHYLCKFNLKGVGVDTISVDKEQNSDYPIHRILLRNMIIVENLNNLDLLPDEIFFFSCFPLKISEADGSPVRAVALVNNNDQTS